MRAWHQPPNLRLQHRNNDGRSISGRHRRPRHGQPRGSDRLPCGSCKNVGAPKSDIELCSLYTTPGKVAEPPASSRCRSKFQCRQKHLPRSRQCPTGPTVTFSYLFLRLVRIFSTNFELQTIRSAESITKFSILSEWYCGQTVSFHSFSSLSSSSISSFVPSSDCRPSVGLYGLSCRNRTLTSQVGTTEAAQIRKATDISTSRLLITFIIRLSYCNRVSFSFKESNESGPVTLNHRSGRGPWLPRYIV